MTAVARDDIAGFYEALQSSLCDAFAGLDGTTSFGVDRWERPGGGGGTTRVLAGDGPIEKAAVNVSTVHGDVPRRLSDRLASTASTFYATGISMIFHPRNPHAPTMHANLRYFETDRGDAWFGGGIDLTPYYLYEEDVRSFHGALRSVCESHDVADYATWKVACDRYFYLPHRNEARGVGGIFYDHLTDSLPAVDTFQRDLGARIFDIYGPLLERRMPMPYDAAQERWHLRRRGRYAEFNLAIDRGTRFGLETGARAESVLASLPPRVRWDYDPAVEPGTPEHLLLQVLAKPQDWT